MSDEIAAFRPVPRTGVIYVTTEAVKRGFSATDPDWCNLGQGQPETGPLPGAPPRVHQVAIAVDDQEYAPVAGLWELREAIAELYNRLYRRGMPSQYSAENVCVSGGGRAALTRAAASLGHVNLGHFLPDYTAYEELLDIFKAFTAIPILLEGERGYAFSADDLRREILGRGLSALLLSNPCNPTGKLVDGDELRALGRDRARARLRAADRRVLLALRLSHATRHAAGCVSAARYVEDVDTRSGGALRRPHQELALPRLARDLGRRPAQGDRRARLGRLVPRRRRLEAAAARGHPAARRRTT